MSTFLFPPDGAKNGARRRVNYPVVLSDLLRGATDAIDALKLFLNLIGGDDNDSLSYGFGAFDAHGGDTNCHVRTGMLLETYTIYSSIVKRNSNQSKKLRIWIERIIKNLERVQAKSIVVCVKLTWEDMLPTEVNLGLKEDLPEQILRKLGWTEALESLMPPKDASECPPQNPFLPQADGISDLDVSWNIFDSTVLVRFVVYSFILAKYMRLVNTNGSTIARIVFEDVETYTNALIKPYWNGKNIKYKHAKIQRIFTEFTRMQAWLSDISCAWLHALSCRSAVNADMRLLVTDTIQKSPKGGKSVASYPGWLLIRESLGILQADVLLVNRHFCGNGYHYNIFTGKIGEAVSCQTRPLGQKLPWSITQSSIAELLSSTDQTNPHVVIVGNSFSGPDFRNITRTSHKSRSCPLQQSGTELCTSPQCYENDVHLRSFKSADHDAIGLALFATHKPYAFDLAEGEDEIEYVTKQMSTWEQTNPACANVQGLTDGWLRIRQIEDSPGASDAVLQIFSWQHMFVETKGRLGAEVNGWMKNGDPYCTSVPNVSTKH
ncbi:hypothetical protein BT63DRAFT_440002 [Microthyrium microscopicum]|uniref:Uncharacterized protein n=1 Tax=Microthyrium microscopicum TaxID=703497 RepID=A0A6A6UBI7_9PEZI|nr:hypothetical protein BT63DRAFT_440002 [Microthyrium microscopicum]